MSEVGVLEIKREEWSFPASHGEGNIYAHAWLVENPLALIQIAHGMSEHGSRYDEFARYLCEQGFCVVANDHAGHGKSAQGHLGAFSSKDGGFGHAVDDLHSLFGLAEQWPGSVHCSSADSKLFSETVPFSEGTPVDTKLFTTETASQGISRDIPHILFGHSMGSLMAAQYAEKYDDLFALILSGAPAKIHFSNVGKFVSRRVTSSQGQLARSPLLERLSGSLKGKTLEEKEQARQWLTRDREKIREFNNDPLAGFDYTAGGYLAILEAIDHINSKEWGKKIPDIPLLVIAGADDTAGGSGKGPTRYAAQLVSTGHDHVTLKLFEDCRHELINELNRKEVYEYIYSWITEQLDKKMCAKI